MKKIEIGKTRADEQSIYIKDGVAYAYCYFKNKRIYYKYMRLYYAFFVSIIHKKAYHKRLVYVHEKSV